MMNNPTSWKVMERADGQWVVLRNGHVVGVSHPTIEEAMVEIQRTEWWWTTLPTSKPCTANSDVDCPQGMVLEVNPYDPTGQTEGLPTEPRVRYRCQDCDYRVGVAR